MEQRDAYHPLALGGLSIRGRLLLAPMAGITDDVMRLLCHRFGAAMTYTEMISAKGLLMSQKSRELLQTREGEGPVAAQLFGSDADAMARAAHDIEQTCHNISMIDINMGCPARKITRAGEGSALLKDLPLAGRIMERVVCAVNLPVSVKIRIGFESGENVAVRIANIAAQSGVCALTVHGRTREQGYAGQADWDTVAQVKQSVGDAMAVIGNGDIRNWDMAQRRMERSGCDGVMIGRAAIGRPWVFSRHAPDIDERLAVIREHLTLEMEKRGEARAIAFMRKILAAYVHGMPGAANARARIFAAGNYDEAYAALTDVFTGMESAKGK